MAVSKLCLIRKVEGKSSESLEPDDIRFSLSNCFIDLFSTFLVIVCALNADV